MLEQCEFWFFKDSAAKCRVCDYCKAEARSILEARKIVSAFKKRGHSDRDSPVV